MNCTPKNSSVANLMRFMEGYWTQSSDDRKFISNLKNREETDADWFLAETLVKRANIKVCRVETDNFVGDFQWDGKLLTSNRCDNLLHDLAHFQCAEPDRRFLPDFGLGPGPDSFEKSPYAPGMTEEESVREEGCASILGILWEIKLGLPFQFTVVLHNWNIDGQFSSELEWLAEQKLVIKGEPVLNFRK